MTPTTSIMPARQVELRYAEHVTVTRTGGTYTFAPIHGAIPPAFVVSPIGQGMLPAEAGRGEVEPDHVQGGTR